ncbi:hypothetical protein [Treponema saccharophilum]|uniref:hypothetical protein n=1 Tax=Treponema saccharophilum TaxID=165 RepID=UPI0038662F6C
MSIPEMIPLIKGVLTEPKVIITTVIIFLYIDIVAKIVRYRKKKKQIKKRPTVVSAPAPATPAAESEEGGE